MASAELPLWPDNPTGTDLLGFSDIAEPIQEALLRDRLDPVAVGVFGDWGSGKTTVLEILSSSLASDKNVVVVYTRPWEYDPNIDPKATLIAEVLEAVRKEAAKDEKLMDKLGDRFKKLNERIEWSKAITLAANSALSLSLPSVSDIAGIFSKDGGSADPTLQGFREEFDKLMGELDKVSRVVVLVDDLDRCLPTTVIAALEAIKLFLSVQKMAFVIAADRRLVTLAISKSYDSSPQGVTMAREYLEKIVQIPVTVPSLGLSDTEGYLAMMLLDRHLHEEGIEKLVAHCDERRRSGQGRLLEEIPDGLVIDEAKSDFALAGVLAPVLFQRLGGNPRRLKRFLNAYWLRTSIAKHRSAALEPTALAKLLVLEELDPDGFSTVIGWLGDGTLKEKLTELENPKGKEGPPNLREWAQTAPPLASADDLGPYLRLAASLRSVGLPGTELPPYLRDIIDGLRASTKTQRAAARSRLTELGEEDKVKVTRRLCDIVRTEPDSQDDIAETLEDLMKDSELATEILVRLEEVDAQLVKPGLIVRIAVDGPRRQDALALVKRWRDSGRLNEVAEAAVNTLTDSSDKAKD